MEHDDSQDYHRKRVIETLPKEMKAVETIGWQEVLKDIPTEGRKEIDSDIISYKPIHDQVNFTFRNIEYRGLISKHYDCIITKWGRELLNKILPKEYYADVTINMLDKYDDSYCLTAKLTRKSLHKIIKRLNRYVDALNSEHVEKIRKERYKMRKLAYGKNAW